MDPMVHLFEGPIVLATLVGLTYAVKVMFWGKGPIRRIKGSAQQQMQRLNAPEEPEISTPV